MREPTGILPRLAAILAAVFVAVALAFAVATITDSGAIPGVRGNEAQAHPNHYCGTGIYNSYYDYQLWKDVWRARSYSGGKIYHKYSHFKYIGNNVWEYQFVTWKVCGYYA